MEKFGHGHLFFSPKRPHKNSMASTYFWDIIYLDKKNAQLSEAALNIFDILLSIAVFFVKTKNL